MSERYGMHVRFTAAPGQGDALADILLEAGEATRSPTGRTRWSCARSAARACDGR